MMVEGFVTFDVYSKLLLKECPQDFISYLVPGATFVCFRDTQFQTRAKSRYRPREMRSDILLEAEMDGLHFLIHVEWQSDKDEEMDVRLHGYAYEGNRLHKLPELSADIYFSTGSGGPPSLVELVISGTRQVLSLQVGSLGLDVTPAYDI